jgi:hypothetical protein
MANTYRVVDLRPAADLAPDITITGVQSPEAAAKQALGLDLVRSGSRKDLVAQVYWQLAPESKNMVRLYARVTPARSRQD